MNFIIKQLILFILNLIMAYVFIDIINIKELNYIFGAISATVTIIINYYI